jgi:hypothetical protein
VSVFGVTSDDSVWYAKFAFLFLFSVFSKIFFLGKLDEVGRSLIYK